MWQKKETIHTTEREADSLMYLIEVEIKRGKLLYFS